MDFVSIHNAAKRLPIGEPMIRAWVKQGRVPGFYVGKRFYVDVEAFTAQIYADARGERKPADSN